MNEDEKPSKRSGDGDGWVTLGSFWSSRRVPGIEETTEPTYVAPKEPIPRKTLMIGAAIILASIAIGTGLVFAAGSDDDKKADDTELNAAATLTSSSTVSSTTTSTAPSTTSTTSTAGVTPSTTRAATATTRPAGGATPVTAAATPRATANPALPPFQAVPLPAGVTATLTSGSCRWAGGTLQSSGTITSTSAAGHRWNMTMHYLQNGRELAKVSGLMDLQPHEGKAWSLPLSQANPPADLACSLEVSVP